MIKRLLAPAHRRRPDAIYFCFVGRLSPAAKDLCGKLSTNDNIILSPAVGGRKNTEQRKRTATRACTAKTNRPDFFRGKQPVFPSGEKQSRRPTPTPFSAKRGTLPFAFHRGREPKSAVFGSLRMKFLFRPSANSFFEKRVTGKHTKKEFGRTLRGKSGFPSVPQGTGGHCPCEPFTLLGKTVRLSRSCFAEVVIRGARAANRSESSI